MDKENTHNGILISDLKNNKVLPFATIGMYLEGIVLYKISQKEKDKYTMISPICWISPTKKKKKPKNTTKILDTQNRLLPARGGVGIEWNRWRNQKVQISSYKLNKSCGYYVQGGDYICLYCTLTVAKWVVLKSSQEK